MKKIRKVLIIEDDQFSRDILSKVLKKEGILKEEASDGREAIWLLDNHEYDLILCDLMMPNIDGFAVIEHIRNILKSSVPILVLSALGNIESIQKAESMGANNYLIKPLDIKQLVRTMKEYFNE